MTYLYGPIIVSNEANSVNGVASTYTSSINGLLDLAYQYKICYRGNNCVIGLNLINPTKNQSSTTQTFGGSSSVSQLRGQYGVSPDWASKGFADPEWSSHGGQVGTALQAIALNGGVTTGALGVENIVGAITGAPYSQIAPWGPYDNDSGQAGELGLAASQITFPTMAAMTDDESTLVVFAGGYSIPNSGTQPASGATTVWVGSIDTSTQNVSETGATTRSTISWAQGPSFPYPLINASVAITSDDVVVVAGGITNLTPSSGTTYTATQYVWTSVIANGILGQWVQQAALPQAVMTQAVAVDTAVYLMGSIGGSIQGATVVSSNSIWWATVNGDGTINSWNTSSQKMPGSSWMRVAVTKNPINSTYWLAAIWQFGVYITTLDSAGNVQPWVCYPFYEWGIQASGAIIPTIQNFAAVAWWYDQHLVFAICPPGTDTVSCGTATISENNNFASLRNMALGEVFMHPNSAAKADPLTTTWIGGYYWGAREIFDGSGNSVGFMDEWEIVCLSPSGSYYRGANASTLSFGGNVFTAFILDQFCPNQSNTFPIGNWSNSYFTLSTQDPNTSTTWSAVGSLYQTDGANGKHLNSQLAVIELDDTDAGDVSMLWFYDWQIEQLTQTRRDSMADVSQILSFFPVSTLLGQSTQVV